MNEKTESFENKMDELEKIVGELEKGNLSLEEQVKKFEEGMKLSKECNDLLQNAEKRITILLEENGEIKEEEYWEDKMGWMY